MFLSRRLPRRNVIYWASGVGFAAILWATAILLLYKYSGFEFLRVPFLPIATIGTAVAFYVGFKNNSSYDRFWEGRKIWGGVVNSSRTWGNFVMSYVRPGDESEEAVETRRVLIYRHMAWINALRLQLRKNSRFFNKPARATARRLEDHAHAMRNDWDKELTPFLSAEEHALFTARKNPATHMLMSQGKDLASLVSEERLDLFHQIAMMEVIEEFYALQGKCERIKNTPFPRIYAEYGRLFTWIFILLVPLGLLDVFHEPLDSADSLFETFVAGVPMMAASGLIIWVFNTMESIGDATEDPFERSMNDVPMNALCRTIEIDMREMLGETELPAKEEPIDHILY